MNVRVLPDVSGLDKEFDYAVPESMVPSIAVGAMVRVELANRRVDGWVTAINPPDVTSNSALRYILKFRGIGPSAEVIVSATTIAEKFMGRRRAILTMASPDTLVSALPADRRHASYPGGGQLADLHSRGGGLIWCGVHQDPTELLRSIARHGSLLAVVPALRTARMVASEMRGSGFSVALMPDDWAQAAAGVDVIIGARGSVWAPMVAPSSIVVWDEHDESLNEERVPTWNTRDVAIERAANTGAACFFVSPTPSPQALEWAQGRIYASDDKDTWQGVKVIDMASDGPVIGSFSSELLEAARDRSKTVLCVTNSTGVGRLLVCKQCKSVARCEKCDSLVVQSTDSTLHCEACGTDRPVICKECAAGAFKNLRRGTTRLCTELAQACGREVTELTAARRGDLPSGTPYVAVGTEALLHRAHGADVVAFIDIDSELNSGFYRANEIALGLVTRALRLVASRGEVIVQTHDPRRPLLDHLARGEVTAVVESELAMRRALNLPPFSVLASVSGAGANAWFDALAQIALPIGCDVNAAAGLVRATDYHALRLVLESVPQQRGERVRFAVQPLRA